MSENKRYALDTSALLTLILDEPGSPTVQNIISRAQKRSVKVFISFVAITELYYRLWRNEGEDAANEAVALVRSLPMEVVQSNDILNLSAGRIKAQYCLSVADAFIAAMALAQDADLVHKDPEFDPLAREIRMVSLPYKSVRSGKP